MSCVFFSLSFFYLAQAQADEECAFLVANLNGVTTAHRELPAVYKRKIIAMIQGLNREGLDYFLDDSLSDWDWVNLAVASDETRNPYNAWLMERFSQFGMAPVMADTPVRQRLKIFSYQLLYHNARSSDVKLAAAYSLLKLLRHVYGPMGERHQRLSDLLSWKALLKSDIQSVARDVFPSLRPALLPFTDQHQSDYFDIGWNPKLFEQLRPAFEVVMKELRLALPIFEEHLRSVGGDVESIKPDIISLIREIDLDVATFLILQHDVLISHEVSPEFAEAIVAYLDFRESLKGSTSAVAQKLYWDLMLASGLRDAESIQMVLDKSLFFVDLYRIFPAEGPKGVEGDSSFDRIDEINLGPNHLVSDFETERAIDYLVSRGWMKAAVALLKGGVEMNVL